MNRQRLAIVLWLVWAVVVWNVVFDRVLVNAGRDYVRTAMAAANGQGPYARIDDRMLPALTQALVAATAAALVIVLVGLVAIRGAARRLTSAERPRRI
jgi:ABC-type Fe3+ transport system permease subunit